MQIYDQIYMENFERTRKEEEQRAREAAQREQQVAWGPPPAGPPGLQNPGWSAEGAGNGWQGGGCSTPFHCSRHPSCDSRLSSGDCWFVRPCLGFAGMNAQSSVMSTEFFNIFIAPDYNSLQCVDVLPHVLQAGRGVRTASRAMAGMAARAGALPAAVAASAELRACLRAPSWAAPLSAPGRCLCLLQVCTHTSLALTVLRQEAMLIRLSICRKRTPYLLML